MKGRQPLEDQSISEYDIGLNAFSSSKSRPKSAKKFRAQNRLRSGTSNTSHGISR